MLSNSWNKRFTWIVQREKFNFQMNMLIYSGWKYICFELCRMTKNIQLFAIFNFEWDEHVRPTWIIVNILFGLGNGLNQHNVLHIRPSFSEHCGQTLKRYVFSVEPLNISSMEWNGIASLGIAHVTKPVH